MNLNPFIDLISSALNLYMLMMFINIILHWLTLFSVVNSFHPLIRRVQQFTGQITEPALSRIRKIIPVIAGIDAAPLVLFLLIQFVQNALYTYFYYR